MQINIKFKTSIEKIAFILMSLHALVGFVWTQMKVDLSLANNIIAVIIVLLLILGLFRGKIIYIGVGSLIWLPFIIYTIIGYLINKQLVYSLYWLSCLLALLLAYKMNDFSETIIKLIYVIGIFFTVGVFFEFFFHGLYDRYIATLYKTADRMILIGHSNYGFAGFTYQLDTTAIGVMFALGIFLYFFRKKYDVAKNVIICIIFLLAILLTGKRIFIAAAIVVPLIISFSTEENGIKRSYKILGVILIVALGVYFILSNAQILYNSKLFHRIGSTIIEYQKGLDYSAGRNNFAKIAISLFKKSPIWGIGPGNFIIQSKLGTDAHNTYLQVLCEQGIIGGIFYVFALVSTLFFTIKKIRNCEDEHILSVSKISLFIQLTYILHGFTGNTNINLYGYMMYYISLSLMLSAQNQNERDILK